MALYSLIFSMKYYLFLALIIACTNASARLDFTIHKLESGVEGPTILVVGGIQGDEPGGFHAASLLVTDYKINKGAIWVVPNLNFESILNSSRGIHGDMNRKFADVDSKDPDYQIVERVKALIRDPQVDFVFNLHDGSGFYREETIDKLRNPHRWGQCVIIDQEEVASKRFGGIGKYSRKVVEDVNNTLLIDDHKFHLKNTKTREGDEEMAKTLTFFAINNGKPAVGLEASKNLNKSQRVYYHLLALESYMGRLGLEFERTFELKPRSIQAAIDSNLRLAMFDEKINYLVDNVRRSIYYVPLEKDVDIDFKSNNPLVAVTRSKNNIKVRYGNKNLTSLRPDYFKYDYSLKKMDMLIDGQEKEVELGTIVHVDDNFVANPPEGYRINVIGWRNPNIRNEAYQLIERNKISHRFSVDRKATLYRVEVYKDEYFSGMVLVNFDKKLTQQVKYIRPTIVPLEEEPKKQTAELDKISLLNDEGTGR